MPVILQLVLQSVWPACLTLRPPPGPHRPSLCPKLLHPPISDPQSSRDLPLFAAFIPQLSFSWGPPFQTATNDYLPVEKFDKLSPEILLFTTCLCTPPFFSCFCVCFPAPPPHLDYFICFEFLNRNFDMFKVTGEPLTPSPFSCVLI